MLPSSDLQVSREDYQASTLQIEVHDVPGVLNQVGRAEGVGMGGGVLYRRGAHSNIHTVGLMPALWRGGGMPQL